MGKDKLMDFKKTNFSISGLLPLILKYPLLSKNIETDISAIDLLRLWNAVRNLRSDRMTNLDLTQSNILIQEKLPDGTLVSNINQDLLEKFISANFYDQLVRKENYSIEVVNATGREKVASQFSRILENLGANVVVISTAKETEKYKCKVQVSKKDLLSSKITDRLKRFYECRIEENQDSKVTDIKVMLGEEFIK